MYFKQCSKKKAKKIILFIKLAVNFSSLTRYCDDVKKNRNMLQINAEQLELLETNSQKFQQCFLENKSLHRLPFSGKNRGNSEKLQLLMQQIFIGLPIEPILHNYPDLAHWVNQLQTIIELPFSKKQLNLTFQTPINNILISAYYDLLVEKESKVTAVNWSTVNRCLSIEGLKNSWETQISLFLLVEKAKLLPENVSLIYYFLKSKEPPTIYQFSYDEKQHNIFKARLEGAISKLHFLLNTNDASFSSSINESEINLQRLFSGELIISEYLDLVPEVEI